MAREELGSKRVCPETGKKFYDLNKDPIVSPYTGKQYDRSALEVGEPVKAKPAEKKPVAKEEVKEEVAEESEEESTTASDGPEIVSLEDAEENADGDSDSDSDDEEMPEIPDVELEVEDDDETDDDAFLDDEDEDEDLSNVIGGVDGEEEV